jgi:hypothetical protein
MIEFNLEIMEILIWTVSIIASIMLTLLLTDPINYLLTQLLGSFIIRKENSISGIWKAVWDYNKDGKCYSIVQFYRVKQLGKYMTAHSINDNINPTSLKGKINSNSFLTGIWIGKFIKDFGKYHGAFQFTIAPTGNIMLGKWIGFNTSHIIKEGNWEWSILNTKLSKEKLRKLKSIETIE